MFRQAGLVAWRRNAEASRDRQQDLFRGLRARLDFAKGIADAGLVAAECTEGGEYAMRQGIQMVSTFKCTDKPAAAKRVR